MNIRIQGIEIACGETIRDNEYYINYLAEKYNDDRDKKRRFFEDVMGRDKRYISEEKSLLQLSYDAADKVLSTLGLTGQDIDLIIYSTNLPEHISPPSALFIHKHINASEHTLGFDMNVNCVGMAAAFNVASNYLVMNKNYKRALIVGCDNLTGVTAEDNLTHYGLFGDVACAVVIEEVEGESQLIDSSTYTMTKQIDTLLAPPEGFYSVLRKDKLTPKDLKVKFKHYEENVYVPAGVKQIGEILSKNGYTIEDIAVVACSQLSQRFNEAMEEILGIPPERRVFIADKYGYTGTSSPFLALYESIQDGRVKRGDLVIIWGAGSGIQGVCNLIRY